MPTPFYDELEEIRATLLEARAFVAAEPRMCRRLDNAAEISENVKVRVAELASGGKPTIALFPAPEPDDRKSMLGLFKASSEIAVEAMRRARFLESALTLRLEGWRVQAEYAPDSQARNLLRAKVEEVERILANARA